MHFSFKKFKLNLGIMAATQLIVTEQIAHVGMRVCRGPEWKYGNEDSVNGKQVPGTITHTGNGRIAVLWDGRVTSTTYFTESIQDKTYIYPLYCWMDVETAEKKEPQGEKVVDEDTFKRDTQLSVGDIVEFRKDMADSQSINGPRPIIGHTYRITTPGKNSVKINHHNWWFSVECFSWPRRKTEVEVPNTVESLSPGVEYLITTEGLKRGDELVFARDLMDSLHGRKTGQDPFNIGDTVKVEGVRMHRIDVNKGIRRWVYDIDCFTLPPSNSPSKVDSLREGLKTVSFSSDKPVDKDTTVIDGYVTWNRPLKKDEVLVCISLANENVTRNGIYLGEMVKIQSTTGSQFICKDNKYWMDRNCFVPVSEFNPSMISYKKEIISKPIKTEDYVKQRQPAVSAEYRNCGYAIKIQSSPAKIREGQVRRQCPVQLRPSKIKIGR